MNASSPIPIHIDGLIYAKQPHGGISRNVTNLINAFAAKPDAHVHLHLRAGLVFPEGMAEVTTHEIPRELRIRPSRVFHRLSAMISQRRCRAYWSSLEEGVFHSSFYSTPDGIRLPQVLTLHDTIFEDFPQMFSAEKHQRHIEDKCRALTNSNAIVFPSAYARDRARAIYALGDRPAVVIPHAVDIRFREVPPPAEIEAWHRETVGSRPFLLHVGARYRHKNVARLLEVYAAWDQRKNFALVLGGGGPLDISEQKSIGLLDLERDVFVLPRMSDEQLRAAYHAASAFVFPSLSEGFGFPVLEALACGCPTASSNAASLPEVGQDAPVYFDPADSASIREALGEVVSRAGDHDHWQRARTRALKRTWADVAGEYLSLYREVCTAIRPRSANSG